MVLSKKKLKKQTKSINETDNLELVAQNKANEIKMAALKMTNDELFKSNTSGGEGLKQKREKLKANRFKEILDSKTSKTEEVLIKRYMATMARKEAAGLAPVQKRQKVSNRVVREDEQYGGELEDIWSTGPVLRSKTHERYLNGFAKKDFVRVKPVINPAGGQSYNPALKDHKSLLQQVAQREEQIIEKNLKELRTTQPFLFRESKEEAGDGSDDDKPAKEEETSSDDVSSDDPDADDTLAVGKPVDKGKIKD